MNMEVVIIIYNDDCIKILNILEPNSVDMIFADPPYFLSNSISKQRRMGQKEKLC